MTVHAEGTYKVEDFKAAQIAHGPWLYRSRYFMYFLGGFYALVFSVEAWEANWDAVLRGAPFAVIFLLLPYLLFDFRFRRMLQSPSFRGRCSFSISESGVQMSQVSSEGNIQWEGFHRWKDKGGVILLYPSPYIHYILPRRFFAEEEHWQAARILFAEKIGPAS